MKNLSLILFAVVLFTALSGRFWISSKAQTSVTTPEIASHTQQTFERLHAQAQKTGSVRVIVGLRTEFIPEGKLGEAEVSTQRLGIKQAQDFFLSRFPSFYVRDLKRFEYIPFIAFEADAEILRQMQKDSSIKTIEEDVLGEPALAESTQIVGAPAAWNSGYSGSGQTIAILDSGVDKNHSFLNGKVVSEACYSSNIPANGSTSVCPNGATESTAPDSGSHCSTSVNGCAHGTNVAGIAAGKGANFSGVAKDANIIAIQMFSKIDNANSCGSNPTPCARYWTSDLIRALERVRTLSNTIDNIVAVNLSLQTGQQFASSCDAQHSATKAAIDNLRSVGIATIICSGNYSFTSALTAPACISSAISVGATDDGSLGTTTNAVSTFSDSSSLLHLLAPGRWINSSVPNNLFQNYSGTSMAAPHVAGAFAVLKQRKPDAKIEQILNALINTGDPTTDSRNGIVKPRIRVDNALQAIGKNTDFDYDGDGKSDISVFRPSLGGWYLLQSSNNSFFGTGFGLNDDLIAPADFDGDGKTDIAVFRPSNGSWYLQQSSNGFTGIQFGASGDIPVPADYDGDGRADISVFRPSTGGWYRLNSSNNQFAGLQFGVSEDKPTAGDFDGDGKADIAVFRPSTGSWYRLNSSNGQFFAIQFGIAEDKPVAADYDGDGKTDVAVFRPSLGAWYRLNSSNGGFIGVGFGVSEDKPVAADYDGDGRADIAVFRPSTGSWYLLRSMSGFTAVQFGVAEDKPTPNAFVQ